MLVFMVALLVVVLCGIAVGILFPTFRWISVLAISILVYFLSLFGWMALNYFRYLDVDRWVSVNSPSLGTLTTFGPPLFPPAILLFGYFVILNRRGR